MVRKYFYEPIGLILLLAMPLSAATTRIWVLNMYKGPDTIQIIDPATNTIVQTIGGIGFPHGVAFSPDGTKAYVASEDESAENAIWAVDVATGNILNKGPLSSRRGNVPAITKDGKRLLVCVGPPRDEKGIVKRDGGALDIVDTATLKIIKSIPMQGHDCYTTDDGKYWIVGAGDKTGYYMTVFDAKNGELLWKVPYKENVATIGIESFPNGAPRRLFVTPMMNTVREIGVVDFERKKEVRRFRMPDEPSKVQLGPPLTRRNPIPMHGTAISPDRKIIAFGSRDANAVFFYSLPDVKLLGHFVTPTVEGAKAPNNGGDPGWVTFTPDGKTLYVASAAANVVSAVDVKTMKEIARINVGQQPDHVWTYYKP